MSRLPCPCTGFSVVEKLMQEGASSHLRDRIEAQRLRNRRSKVEPLVLRRG